MADIREKDKRSNSASTFWDLCGGRQPKSLGSGRCCCWCCQPWASALGLLKSFYSRTRQTSALCHCTQAVGLFHGLSSSGMQHNQQVNDVRNNVPNAKAEPKKENKSQNIHQALTSVLMGPRQPGPSPVVSFIRRLFGISLMISDAG